MIIFRIKHCIFFFFLLIVLFISCTGQQSSVFAPVPDFSVYENTQFFKIENIIENRNLPEWLRVYIFGGIEAVERLETYSSKYVFIANNEGTNISVLRKWEENISPMFDFPMLAAKRIENRMISAALLYPDDEYGMFFESMMKNAYSDAYHGAVKEDSHWVKVWYEDEETGNYMEEYISFVLMTIERTSMQAVVRNMMLRSNAAVTVSYSQAGSINRLRQNFFEGF
ncbi:MAG: hypothetical protein FWD14_01355 [Treponema sp.]|nr:hypothetical protein [Treponema sp.]